MNACPQEPLASLLPAFSFDFHLHSCLSPCGAEDMTPANIAAMCALAGLQIVALTDHNTTGNCAPFCRAAAALGLLALPGMELTTAEEIHVVCLFPDLPSAQAFGAVVYRHLPDVPNSIRIFGPQVFMDELDGVLGEELRMLAGATSIGIYQVRGLVSQFGGVCYPAHIDRPSFSLLSNLGLWDASLGFSLAEVSHNRPPNLLARPDLRGVFTLTGSDAHYLEQIADPTQEMVLPHRTPAAVLDWLRAH